MRRSYKPGDTFKHQMLEFVARRGYNSTGCDNCVGQLKTSICDVLPLGCNEDEIIWKPSNDSAKMLVVLMKLDAI